MLMQISQLLGWLTFGVANELKWLYAPWFQTKNGAIELQVQKRLWEDFILLYLSSFQVWKKFNLICAHAAWIYTSLMLSRRVCRRPRPWKTRVQWSRSSCSWLSMAWASAGSLLWISSSPCWSKSFSLPALSPTASWNPWEIDIHKHV